jgi:hypothetical protein
MNLAEGLRIKGKITISVYRAGMVEAIAPYLKKLADYKKLIEQGASRAIYDTRIRCYVDVIEEIKQHYFIKTAVECPNLIMDSPNYGLDLIIQRLVGTNTYSLNILYGEIGTGSTTPALTDTALTTPTNRAAVGFQQDYGTTDAILQFFFSDSQLANETYNEFGTFVDGNTTIGTGQLFNHALLSPAYAKSAGTDTTVQVDINIANT